jgi:hypothetical protein
MKPLRIVIAGVALALQLSVASAFAVEVPPLPTMTVTIGGEAISLTPNWNFDAVQDRFSLAGPLTATTSAALNFSTFTIGSAEAVPDPLLLFSASATNNSGIPLAYSFAFNTSLVPNLLGPVSSHAELGVTLTDGLNNGATVQPALPGSKMLTSFDLYASGAPISKNVDIGTLFSIASGTGGTAFLADNSLFCGSPCVTMSAILSFTLTAEDAAGFSGKVVQNAVPIPGAVWLFGSGLLGLGRIARRKGV